ncbi:MAG: MazG nucleotide pyrophosphohydrolase domain-containing protein, partial [Rhodothermales bacterium]
MAEKVYDDEFRTAANEIEAYADFSAVIRQLRRDCPWDREQTHESVKHLLIEEAYETVSAIDAEEWDELPRELGDLLLHVLFHSVIAEGDGRFTVTDVIRTETKKLVRRHPHVFGDVDADDVDAVLRNWEEI